MSADHRRRWSEKDGVTTFRKPCNKSNGLAWDNQGRLLACQHASSRLTRTEADGSITVLASHHGDKELNSPNDVVVKRDGAIYFSDPSYSRRPHFGVPRPLQLDFRGVYRLAADGKRLTLLAADFAEPNGLCFSLDEKVMFVNDTDRQHIRAFDVASNGTLATSRVWARTVGEGAGAPDGMKIDSAGNPYCCGPGGIHVFAADATDLGVIKVPEVTANFCWGDDHLKTLLSPLRRPSTAPGSIHRACHGCARPRKMGVAPS